MNRINGFIVLFASFILTFTVVFLFVRQNLNQEVETIEAPLLVEAYRVDRYPLYEADVYLNQRFVGRTDQNGFFSTDVTFTVGKQYTLVVEKDREGFTYGPWETNFKVQEEREPRRKKPKPRETAPEIESLEGEFDVLTELERAQHGRVGRQEKYHFLAIVDGHMYYHLLVHGEGGRSVSGAAVYVNGKGEGITDSRGSITLTYGGSEVREELIEVRKEGEHMWRRLQEVRPDRTIQVELDKLLLLEMRGCSEMYGTVDGIPGMRVFHGENLLGASGMSGRVSGAYENQSGVNGYLDLRIIMPSGFLPSDLKRTYLVERGLEQLSDVFFAYPGKARPPRIAVLPLRTGVRNRILQRRARDIGSRIADYLSVGGIYRMVDPRRGKDLLLSRGLDPDMDISWVDRPMIKEELDGVVFGEIEQRESGLYIRLTGIDYRGELVAEFDETIALREIESSAQNFAEAFRTNFPYEGIITDVGDQVRINIGSDHGVRTGNKFYSYLTLFDDTSGEHTRKRVAKLTVTGVESGSAACAVETIAEGYLLEPGGKVKRFSEPSAEIQEITVTIQVTSAGAPIQGANVYLDDRWEGQTDPEGSLPVQVSAGVPSDLLVYKEGFIPAERELEVQEKTKRTIRVELTRGYASFTIDSEPSGADVYLDGEHLGKTPLLSSPVSVPYGFHLVELKMEGYKSFREYLKFDSPRVALDGSGKVTLHLDLFARAEQSYRRDRVQATMDTLEKIGPEHPDHLRALEFLGYIHLNDLKDYREAVGYYDQVLDIPGSGYREDRSVISYYNGGQAHYLLAESLFYTEPARSRVHYVTAAGIFQMVRERRSRIPVSQRGRVHQDSLFYLAVSWQKLYYLEKQEEYLRKARYAWRDYFDFFRPGYLRDPYFENQRSIAESYRAEVERLRSETR